MEIQDFLTFEIENASFWMVHNPDSNSDSKKKTRLTSLTYFSNPTEFTY